MNKQQSEKSCEISHIIANCVKYKLPESLNTNIARIDNNKNLHNVRIRVREIVSRHKPEQVEFPFFI